MPEEADYEPQREWIWHPPWKGYKCDFPRPETDFAIPYTPTIEEELEELI